VFKNARTWSFKKIIAIILMVMMGIVIILSIFDLGLSIIEEISTTRAGLIDNERLPSIFGLFLWVMVGIELFDAVKMYTLDHAVHVETILIVGIIAISNHIIATDLIEVPATTLLAMSGILLALSTGYFLVKKAHVGTELHISDLSDSKEADNLENHHPV
jgi:uncharacterized membrane protein (DUF373 family)